jgi:hypothetical protein
MRYEDIDPSFPTRLEIALESGNPFLLHSVLADAEAQYAAYQKARAIKAYIAEQEVYTVQFASFSLDELMLKFEETRDYDEAWALACAIADLIGSEAATPYFKRVNTLA